MELDDRRLPHPETKADEYLYAIATELRRLTGLIAELAQTLTPPAPAGDTVALKEPARKGKPAKYQDTGE